MSWNIGSSTWLFGLATGLADSASVPDNDELLAPGPALVVSSLDGFSPAYIPDPYVNV
jgi:hypothetical protein